jgi:division protein CdvB (Snf7/Vps24/ESCRT-III family)
MKVNELIQKLQNFDQDLDVVVMNLNLNAANDDSEGSVEGIYPEFDVELMQDTNNQTFLTIVCNFTETAPVNEEA